MSNIRFYINEAAWIGYNTARAAGARDHYKQVLDDASVNYSGIADYSLSLDNQKPSHSLADPRGVKRNNIVLKTWDESIEIELESVFVSLTQGNRIVTTPLAGQPGSFKERVQAEDHKITISGSVFTDSRNAFPINELLALRKILAISKQVKVASVYLQLFGVTRMVFQTGRHKLGKYANSMDFNLKFLSDEEFSLYVEE